MVIDSCRVKEISFDAERNMTSLEGKLAAKDALRQRRGRAGRVKEGRCFKLISENTFQVHSLLENNISFDAFFLSCEEIGGDQCSGDSPHSSRPASSADLCHYKFLTD